MNAVHRPQTPASELHESHELGRRLFEASADRVEILDREARLVRMNARGRDVLARAGVDALPGRRWEDLWAEPSRAAVRRALEAVRAGDPSASFEASGPTVNQSTPQRWNVEVTPLHDRNGELTRFLVIARDVSSRPRSEASSADQERLRFSVAAAALGSWSWDLRSGALAVSDLGLALFGLPPGTPMTYERFLSVVHPDDRARVNETVRNAVRSQTRYDIEYRCVWPDGTVHWVGGRGHALYDAGGRPLRFEGVSLDITRRKLAEEARQRSEALLAEREAQLALAVEHCPAPIAMFDRQMRYIAASRRWLSDFRLEGPVVGLDSYEIFPYVSQRWRDVHQRCLAGAVERCEEDAFEWPDGHVEWMRWEVRPWRTASGEVGGIVIFAETITEQKQAQEKLRLSEERLRLAITGAALGTWHWDFRTGQLLWSDLCYAMFGLPPTQSLTYEQYRELVHPDDRERMEEAVERAVRDHSDYNVELRIRWPGGSVHWLAARGRAFYAGDGTPERMEGVVMDITQHRRLEEELRQAQKMEAIGRLAGGVAHDFNNLLTVILGQASVLERRQDLPKGLAVGIADIASAAERAASLTAQLLAFGRRQTLQVCELELNEVVTNIGQMLQRLLGENITLRFEPAARSLRLHADRNMLGQVLLNLALNARDAMPDGGSLTIRASLETLDAAAAQAIPEASAGSWACLTVSDTGAGIAPETLPRIFEPFFTTKEVGKGTGLGLATVYGIVKQHRGFMTVDSTLARGTTFKVFLPVLATEVAARAAARPERAPRGRGELILFVEDEASVRLVISRMLEQHGYRLIVVADGRQALQAFAAHGDDIDLLLTDVVMPHGLSGSALAAQLQARKPGLKIILCSGYSAESIVANWRALPRTAFLSKPYRAERLLSLVRQMLDTDTLHLAD